MSKARALPERRIAAAKAAAPREASDADQVVEILRKAGGSRSRDQIRKETGWSQVRLSEALVELRVSKRAIATRGRAPNYTLNADYEAPEVPAEDRDALLKALTAAGGRNSNARLMEELGWESAKYYTIRNALLEAGFVRKGRGRGGVTELDDPTEAAVEPTEDAETVEEHQETARESDLYAPLRSVLASDWAGELQLDRDHTHVEITAHQGRRITGGTWTRPDLVVVSFRRFKHLPDPVFDLITVEVKPLGKMDIPAVYEAAAHSRFATRSFVAFHVDAELDPAHQEVLDECLREADRHGIGVVTFSNPSDFQTWEIHSEGKRRIPDPLLLDDFISRQISSEGRTLIAGWYADYWRARVKEAL